MAAAVFEVAKITENPKKDAETEKKDREGLIILTSYCSCVIGSCCNLGTSGTTEGT